MKNIQGRILNQQEKKNFLWGNLIWSQFSVQWSRQTFNTIVPLFTWLFTHENMIMKLTFIPLQTLTCSSCLQLPEQPCRGVKTPNEMGTPASWPRKWLHARLGKAVLFSGGGQRFFVFQFYGRMIGGFDEKWVFVCRSSKWSETRVERMFNSDLFFAKKHTQKGSSSIIQRPCASCRQGTPSVCACFWLRAEPETGEWAPAPGADAVFHSSCAH